MPFGGRSPSRIGILAVALIAALLVLPSPRIPAGRPPVTPGPGGGPNPIEPAVHTGSTAPPAGMPRTIAVRESPTGPLPAPSGNWSTYEFAANRSGHNFAETTLSPQDASTLRVIWNVSFDGPLYASPTVVNGTVYEGSWDGVESALYAANGTFRWNTSLGIENSTGQSWGCPWANPLGVTSAAAVVGSTVYVGSATKYYALNATTGSSIWSYSEGSASSGYYAWSSPLVYAGDVYVGIASQCDNPLVDGGLLELNATTGSLVHHLDTAGGSTGSAVWSSPSVDAGTNTVWITTGNGPYDPSTSAYGQAFVAVNASTLKVQGSWQVPAGPNDIDFGAGATLMNDSAGHLGAVATNKDGYAYAVNRSDLAHAPLWSDRTTVFPGPSGCQPPGQAVAPATFDGSTVFLPSSYTTVGGRSVNGSVRAADPWNGTYRWQTATNGTVQGGLASANGLVVDVSRRLPYHQVSGGCYGYSATNDSWLQVLDASNGDPLYTYYAPYAFAVAPSIADGRIFVAAGTAYETEWTAAPAHEGHLFAFGIPLSGSVNVAENVTDPATLAPSDEFTANVSGGMPGYACTWFDGGTEIGTGCQLYDNLSAGPHFVTVVALDAADEAWNTTLWVNISQVPLTVRLVVAPPSIDLGANVSVNVTVSGGTPPYRYAYSGFPRGCTLSNLSGFSCTPQEYGTFRLGVSVLDAARDSGAANATLQVNRSSPPPPPPPVIHAFSIAPGIDLVGTPIRISGTITGGAPPLTVTLSPLPDVCVSAGSLNLTCTPAAPWAGTVTARVVDAEGRAAHSNASVLVVAHVSITGFTVGTGAPAEVGASVPFAVAIVGGSSPYSAVYAGLPPGCPATNLTSFSCAPTRAGSYTISVEITARVGGSATASASVVVLAHPGSPVGAENPVPGIPLWEVLLPIAGVVAAGTVVLWVLRRRGPGPPSATR